MQRLCSVLVALEGCDRVGDDGVGGEVLDTEGGAVSHRAALLLGGCILEGTYVQELRVMDLLAIDGYFSHGCFLCVGHQVDRDLER